MGSIKKNSGDCDMVSVKKIEKKQTRKLSNGESVAVILLAIVVGFFFIGIIGGIIGILIAAYFVNKYRIKNWISKINKFYLHSEVLSTHPQDKKIKL